MKKFKKLSKEERKAMLLKYSNGCTKAPDLNFKSCCDNHDLAYELKRRNKYKADYDLMICMLKRGHIILAPLYWVFVSTFGWFYY